MHLRKTAKNTNNDIDYFPSCVWCKDGGEFSALKYRTISNELIFDPPLILPCLCVLYMCVSMRVDPALVYKQD